MSLMVPPFGSGQFVRILLSTVSRIGRLFGAGVLVFACAQDVAAQEVYYPGSVWTSNGTLSTFEKDNVISQTHMEQGIAIRGAELFGQATGVYDSKGYDWNRRFSTGVGARFTQQMKSGMVRMSVAYVRERRYEGLRITTQGLVVAAEAWFGWNNAPRPAPAAKP